LGASLALHFGVKSGEAYCDQNEFAGCCAPFYTKPAGHVCPTPLNKIDKSEWSLEDGTDLDPVTGKEV
jgi:hypothetical protein